MISDEQMSNKVGEYGASFDPTQFVFCGGASDGAFATKNS